MDRRAFGPYLTLALFLTLVGSIFSTIVPIQQSLASHTDIEDVTVAETEYQQGDTVVIEGTVDGGDDNDQVDITVEDSEGDDDGPESVDLDDEGDFSFDYEISDSAEDGLFKAEIEFEGEESVFVYFIVNEDHDSVVETDQDTYDLGDDVTIEGTIDEDVLSISVDEVEITVLDPTGDEVVDTETADVDSDDGDFSYDEFTLDDGNDAHGMYAVIVSYDDNEEAWSIFSAGEDSGSSSDPITVNLNKTTYKQGENVIISGEVDEREVGEEVFVTVEDDDGEEVFDDSEEPSSTRTYSFDFDLEDDALTGTYSVKVEYRGDDATKTFTVSSSTSGGSTGGSGSGSNSGLTARLSKSSLLAGETLTVSGVVPRIVSGDVPVNVVVLKPDGRFAGVSTFPEPSSDKTYTTTLRLPSTLEVDDDYSVIVSYDSKDVKLLFDITGTGSGSGGAVSVHVDKTSYAVGSTVRITGEIADDTFVSGLKAALQVYNPDKALYRTDPIDTEDDGTFSYLMPVGGPLGVTGKWVVKVTYNSQVGETTFDLTGGVPSKPGYDLQFEGQTFRIEYESDGTINSMYLRPTEKKLVVAIEGDQDGKLTITLPRQVIDAVQSGSDVKYVVSILDTETGDEKVVDVSESLTNSNARTLVIDYDQGTDLIEIQGTTIVPEFGTVAAIVLAIAVLGMIVMTSRLTGKFSTFKLW